MSSPRRYKLRFHSLENDLQTALGVWLLSQPTDSTLRARVPDAPEQFVMDDIPGVVRVDFEDHAMMLVRVGQRHDGRNLLLSYDVRNGEQSLRHDDCGDTSHA